MGRGRLGRVKARLDTKIAEMMEKMADVPETTKEVRTEDEGQTEEVQQGQGRPREIRWMSSLWMHPEPCPIGT